MSAWSELKAREKLAKWFIDSDPVPVTLHRPVWGATEAGGRAQIGSDTLAEQTFHVYPFKRRLTVEYVHNPQTYGEEKAELIHWIMIFQRHQDIQVNDFFDAGVDINPPTNRLRSGMYIVTFISARAWDRGQAGILYRG
jgi:hypothetical protein